MTTRRTMLKSIAGAAGAAYFAGRVWGMKAVAQATIPVRRSYGDLDLDDPHVQTYRDFVAAMQGQAAPVNWASFSEVHGDSGGFNLCPHGNWFFLPWHRGYLRMYEQAARSVTGNSEFAMPYWDWTVDRQIPRAFSDPTWNGSPNPLFNPTRTMSPTDSLPDDMVGQLQVMDAILAEPDFEAFGTSRPFGQNNLDQSWITGGGGIQGPLESNPHNRVHCRVGGIMCSGASPIDPIFMSHHGNIDRLWALWNDMGGVNTADPLWLDMPFTDHFIAPDGSRYTDMVSSLLEVEPLGYTYDFLVVDPPVEPPVDPDRYDHLSKLYGRPPMRAEEAVVTRAVVEVDQVALALRPLAVAVPLGKPELEVAVEAASLRSPSQGRQVVAIIHDMPAPGKNDAEYRIFVNCDYLSQETPTSDPHYCTTIGYFGTSHEHGGGDHAGGKAPPSFMVDLTSALKRLDRGKRLLDDTVTVQILPVPRPGVSLADASAVSPARIEVAVI